jgi:hypothetical protein
MPNNAMNLDSGGNRIKEDAKRMSHEIHVQNDEALQRKYINVKRGCLRSLCQLTEGAANMRA